ncbi:MAG: histidine kinase [Ilumatobacteraceae bacterium]|nr:histidine kinase [Ilumatobacteraceae bacterium]
MRRRLLRAFLAVIVVGVTVLGVPLGIIATHLAREQAVRSLDREADAIGFAVSEPSEKGGAVPFDAIRAAARTDRYVVVRDTSGRTTRVGTRPSGRTIEARVSTETGVHITVVASATDADNRAVQAWLVVAGLAAIGIGTAVVLGVRESNRLGRPLDDLVAASHRLGGGDFSVHVEPAGIPEVDAVGDALTSSGARIAELIGREREFSSNASHQLRTPLTALRVRLEEAAMGGPDEMGPALADAFAEVERLDETINELLSLARSNTTTETKSSPLRAITDLLRQRWEPLLARAERRVDIDVDVSTDKEPLPVQPVTEILNVLMENALRHGDGVVHVGARRAGNHLVISVSDEGPGIAPGIEHAVFNRHVSGNGGTGVGLALARTMAQAMGARRELIDPRSARFDLFVSLPPR